MPTTDRSAFPADFVWGTATASYQIEGAVHEDGRGPSIWDTFVRTPGAISDGTVGDVADDHYHRYAEDIEILAGLGFNAYRFSIAWPRIQPTGSGPANQAGLDFYRRIAETCHQHGITPYATLYHWDLPQALEDQGGWLDLDTAAAFRDYAAMTHDALGDVIKHWITLNEPWCSAFLGYGNGVHAPGLQVGTDAFKAAHHLLLGHGLAMSAMRESRHKDSVLGITVNLYSVHAASDSEVDREAARRTDGIGNRFFLDPLLLGSYPSDVLLDAGLDDWFGERQSDLAVINAPVDFMGINYYSRHTAAGPEDGVFADPGVPSAAPGSERVQMVDTGADKTLMGWEIHPDGLVDVIEMVAERAPGLPIFITENGAAYEDELVEGQVEDEERRHYFELHVDACRQAVEKGLPLTGYFAWSLMDNFEWAFGFSRRFGIVHVDYDTQVRTVKRSGAWFRDFLGAATS